MQNRFAHLPGQIIRILTSVYRKLPGLSSEELNYLSVIRHISYPFVRMRGSREPEYWQPQGSVGLKNCMYPKLSDTCNIRGSARGTTRQEQKKDSCVGVFSVGARGFALRVQPWRHGRHMLAGLRHANNRHIIVINWGYQRAYCQRKVGRRQGTGMFPREPGHFGSYSDKSRLLNFAYISYKDARIAPRF
jgi:hypothetical protein